MPRENKWWQRFGFLNPMLCLERGNGTDGIVGTHERHDKCGLAARANGDAAERHVGGSIVALQGNWTFCQPRTLARILVGRPSVSEVGHSQTVDPRCELVAYRQ